MSRSARWRPLARVAIVPPVFLAGGLPMERAATEATPAPRCRTMTDVRREIDRVDRSLVALLAERLSYIRRAGEIKTDRRDVHDETRIADIVAKVRGEAERSGLEPSFVEPLWRELMRLSIAYEFTIYDSRTTRTNRV